MILEARRNSSFCQNGTVIWPSADSRSGAGGHAEHEEVSTDGEDLLLPIKHNLSCA